MKTEIEKHIEAQILEEIRWTLERLQRGGRAAIPDACDQLRSIIQRMTPPRDLSAIVNRL